MSAEEKVASAPPRPPDLSRAPNFDALVKWVHSLNAWCDAAVVKLAEGEKLEQRNAELQGLVDDADRRIAEAEQQAGSFEELVLFVQDVERRVRTGPELFDFMRRNGWMS
jgi:hypothetical protein